MFAAKAIVTARGGLAAHAAVVARGLGRPAVCGATDLRIDLGNRTVTAHGHTLLEGAQISVDGSSGQLYSGAVHVVPPRPGDDLEALLRPRRRPAPAAACGRTPTTAATPRSRCSTGPRASGCAAPSTSSSAIACRWSAGTCWPPTRPRRPPPSPSSPRRRRRTSSTCSSVTGNRPVTVRLLDAPLHEFLGDDGPRGQPDAGAARRAARAHPHRALPGPGEGAVQRMGRARRHRRHPAARGDGAARRASPASWRHAIESIHGAAAEVEAATGREGALPRRHHDRDTAGGADRRRAGRDGAVHVLRHQRPDPTHLRLLARRRRGAAADRLRREGPTADQPVREPRPGRRRRADPRRRSRAPGRSTRRSSSASAASTAATRPRSSCASSSAWTTCRARPRGCRARAWRARTRPSGS